MYENEDPRFPFVAPLAGAWIETYRFHAIAKQIHVAPLAGAWIETLLRFDLRASL